MAAVLMSPCSRSFYNSTNIEIWAQATIPALAHYGRALPSDSESLTMKEQADHAALERPMHARDTAATAAMTVHHGLPGNWRAS